jgi:hypothetical protein
MWADRQHSGDDWPLPSARTGMLSFSTLHLATLVVATPGVVHAHVLYVIQKNIIGGCPGDEKADQHPNQSWDVSQQ